MTIRARRAGFTLVEVMIALTLLAIGILGLTTATTPFVHLVTTSRLRHIGGQAADAQIAAVRQWPTYATIDSAFAGTTANVPLTGWQRVTTVTRVGGAGQANDFRRITVVVTGPGLPAPIQRTITVAAP